MDAFQASTVNVPISGCFSLPQCDQGGIEPTKGIIGTVGFHKHKHEVAGKEDEWLWSKENVPGGRGKAAPSCLPAVDLKLAVRQEDSSQDTINEYWCSMNLLSFFKIYFPFPQNVQNRRTTA